MDFRAISIRECPSRKSVFRAGKGSAVFSGGAGGARAPPEFGGSQKGQSLISAYQSLAITMNTPGFEKLNTALLGATSLAIR